MACRYGNTDCHGDTIRVREDDVVYEGCTKHVTVDNIFRQMKGQYALVRIHGDHSSATH